MIKFKVKVDDAVKDIEKFVKAKFKRAVAKTALKGSKEAVKLASKNIGSSGFKLWSKGYKVVYKSDTSYVFQVDGVLANMIEEGISGSKLKEMLIGGKRFKHNVEEAQKSIETGPRGGQVRTSKRGNKYHIGKDAASKAGHYVDIPLKSSKITKAGMDADAMSARFEMKPFTFHDFKAGKIKTSTNMRATIKDAMENMNVTAIKQEGKENPAFMAFRRITPNSQLRDISPADILKELEKKLEKIFEEEVKREFK